MRPFGCAWQVRDIVAVGRGVSALAAPFVTTITTLTISLFADIRRQPSCDGSTVVR
jgi:hypothetical protein